MSRRELIGGWSLLLLYFIFLILLGTWCLTNYPNTGDEHAILFQAKIFSRLWAHASIPPFPEFFLSHSIVMHDGSWFAISPPLYPLWITPGVWLGYPLLMTALLSCLSLTLIYRFARKNGEPPQEACLFAAFVAISPTFVFHSVSLYTHMGTLCLLLLALDQFDGWAEPPRVRRPLLLGFVLGLGFGVRTYTTFLLSLPFLVLLILQLHQKTLSPKNFLRVVIGGSSALVIVLLLNSAISGYAADFHFIENVQYRFSGHNSYDGVAATRLGDMLRDGIRWTFGRGPWTIQNLKYPENGAFPWGASLLAAGAIAALTRLRTSTSLLLALALILFLGHFSFENNIAGRFGERYFFETHFIWIWLVWIFLKRIPGRNSRLAVLTLMAISMISGVVSTAKYLRTDNLRRMDPFLQANRLGPRPKLIFVRDAPDFDPPWYSRNEPDLSGTLFVRDLGAHDRDLVEYFHDLPAFTYLRDSTSGRGALVPWPASAN